MKAVQRRRINAGSVVARNTKDRAHELGRGSCSKNENQSPCVEPVAIEQTHSMAIDVENQLEGVHTTSEHQEGAKSLFSSRTAFRKERRNMRREATGRRKWSKEDNMEIVRLYYKVNNCQDLEGPAYRQKLFEAYTQLHPEHTFTIQNIVDRRRVIFKKNYVSVAERDEIKRTVGNELMFQNTFQTEEPEICTPLHGKSTEELQLENEQLTPNTFEDKERIEVVFNGNLAKYHGTSPIHRPLLPRINPNKRTDNIIYYLNILVENYLQKNDDFDSVHLATYCAAVTVAELMHISLKSRFVKTTEGKKKVERKPAWQKRLERNVADLRKDIGYLTALIQNRTTGEKAKNILKQLSINPNSKLKDADKVKVNDYIDTLKQKLKAKAARLARYKRNTNRKSQNLQFRNNQKQFYRQLSKDQKIYSNSESSPLSENDIMQYWSQVWDNPKSHNEKASWLKLNENDGISEMPTQAVTLKEVRNSLIKTMNWKAPGVDGIHNYWWKRLTSTHIYIVNFFNNLLSNPEIAPEFITQGNTYLLFKAGDKSQPQNYRPITCLPTIYKLLTSVIARRISTHLHNNDILTKEQKGCTKGTYGCKEQLIVDSFILKQVQKKSRNLSVAYVDYCKAFDSVPHSWLIEVLKLYKIDFQIIGLLKQLMKTWRTKLHCLNLHTNNVSISRGIFQGDSLSPIWFCMALNPLSKMLNECNYGYRIDSHNQIKTLTHLLYMDDIKLFAGSEEKLNGLLNIVEMFSNDVNMSLGVQKCAIVNIRKGQYVQGSSYEYGDGNFIQCLEKQQLYRYLGIPQNNRINQTEIKSQFKKQYLHRVRSVLKTELVSKHKFSAINSWAVPLLTFSFGIIDWKDSELESLNRKTRSLLTKYRYHPQSSLERLYLPRKLGGRGLLDLENLCFKQIYNLRKYFQESPEPIHQVIVKLDKYTPLKLSDNMKLNIISTSDRQNRWLEKPLHGQFPNSLMDGHVDILKSNLWLNKGQLHAETEGFMCAIQDQVLPTRYYRQRILHSETESKCRACNKDLETIHHIISGCQNLASDAYTNRHNQVAKIVYQQLVKTYNLLKSFPPYYKFQPPPVLENDKCILYWDKQIITDKTMDFNKPDIILVDKMLKKTYIIDVAVPCTSNLSKTESTKISKYQNLRYEIRRIWKQDEVVIIPIVISATGVVPKTLEDNIKKLPIQSYVVPEIHKAVILQTCHVTRKFLNLE